MINFVVSTLENVIPTEKNGMVKSEIIDLIQQLKEKDINFCVATSKNYDAVKDIFGPVKADIVYICNEGGVVIHHDKVISKTPVDRLVCYEVSSEFEDMLDYDVVFSGERNAVVTRQSSFLMQKLRNMGIEPEILNSTKDMSGEITKVTIFAKKGLSEEDFAKYYGRWGNKAHFSATNEQEAFLTGEYVSKGTALAVVQQVYDISEEDTVVFGNGFSDIEMFDHSFYSYALQSADAQVKNSAKHITEDIKTIMEDIIRM